MKRFGLQIGLFVLVVALVYLPAVWLLGSSPLHGNISYVPNNYGHLHSRMEDLRNYSDVDILFLGSSHSYRSFDTRSYAAAGLRTFNLGSSNQTPLQTEVLLQEYLDSLRPRFVVFEVHPDIMANSGVESAVDLISNCPVSLSLLRMSARLHTPRVINTLAYAAFQGAPPQQDSIITVPTRVNGIDVPATFAYVPGGFVELPAFRYRPSSIKPHTFVAQPAQQRALHRCVAMLRQRNIPFVLLEVPSSRTLYTSYTNHSDFEVAMAAEGPYVNLNDSVALTDQLSDSIHFFDEDHLNRYGVKILNQYLLSCLSLD